MKKALIFVVLLILCSSSLFAQITINNNYMPMPGTVQHFAHDVTFDAVFYNSLSSGTGGPFNWDFSGRTYNIGFTNYIVDPLTTPGIDSFPNADLVIMSTVGADSSWLVYQSTMSQYTQLGSVFHGSGAELFEIYYDMVSEYSFPLNYNDNWTSYRHSRLDAGVSYSIYYDTTDYVIDAWGTIQYSSNSIPCLRVIVNRRLTINTYDLMDNLLASVPQTIQTVLFVDADFNQQVGASRVTFLGNDTYSGSARNEFINIATDVERLDIDLLPSGFALSQNYPNPFNPSTEIQLNIPSRAYVTLKVYDITGREVAILVDEPMTAGTYTVDWDGRNKNGQQVASGVYVYRLLTDGISLSKKMLLMK